MTAPVVNTVFVPGTTITHEWLNGVNDYVNGQHTSDEINYTPPFTGAVTETVTDKLAQYVSVKDFGAVGDGVTDDTAAIQNAIDNIPVGSSLYFPEGKYLVSSPININIKAGNVSGLTLFGDRIGSIIEAVSNIDSIFYVTGAQTNFNGLQLSSGTATVSKGLHLAIGNYADYSGNIENCLFYGFTYGIYANGQNFGISQNWFQSNVNHIHFYNDGRNTYIDKNYMLGGSSGITLEKTTIQAEGTRITNNTILCTGINGAGIVITDGLEIYIGFNIVDQSGNNTGGLIMGASGGTISSIKIESNWLSSGAGQYCLFSAGNNTFIEIVNNTFAGTNCTGLSLTNSNQCNIFCNRFLLTTPVSEYSTASTANINFAYNYQSNGNQFTNSFVGFTTLPSLGIGTNPNSSSAILEITSTTQGVRFPNMISSDKNAIVSPVKGLVVFDATLNKLCVYSGSAWETITSV